MKHFAVILGQSPTGLYATRELGNEGIDTVVAAPSRGAAGWSRHARRGGFLRAEPGPQLREALLELAARHGHRGVLVPTSDAFIEFVVDHRDELATQYEFQSSYTRETFDRVVDKRHFYETCRDADIPTPATLLGPVGDLVEGARELRAPFLLKPALIHAVRDWMAGRKVLVADDHATLAEAASSIPSDAPTEWILQEVIPGPESEIMLYGAHATEAGEFRQEFTARKLRQYPAGFGSASLVRSHRDAETVDLSRRLLQALQVAGVAGTEFKRDPRDGRLCAIEVNPRPTLWFDASHAAGKRIVASAFAELTGNEPLPEQPQDERVAWRYGLKDMASARAYRRAECSLPAPEVAQGMVGARRSHAVFRWSDPLPLVGELGTYARKAKRIFLK